MRKNFIKGLALGMAVCMGVVGCGTNSSSSETGTTAGKEDQTTVGAEDETTTEAEAEEFPAYDFGGQTFTILNSNDVTGKNPDNIEDDPESDEDDFQREERQEWIDYIEDKYNCELVFVEAPATSWDEIPQEIVNAYTAGKPIADIMDVYYNYLAPLVINDVLYDMKDDFAKVDTYNEANVHSFLGKSFGICSPIAGEGLYYNADMIENAGMDYTPAEMFAMGKWDYDSCYDYLTKLQSNLAEGEYALFVSGYYWALFGSTANGVKMLGDDGRLCYINDNFIQTMEFLQKCVQNGICINSTEAGISTWSYPGETFDQGHTVAIAHRAAWQASGCVGKFNMGFVPYPWGDGVTVDADKIGDMDAYTTIDGYMQTYYDGQVMAFIKNIKDKADPIELTSMMCEFMGWKFMLASYEPEEGSDPCGWLVDDSIDEQLYSWSRTKEVWNYYNTVNGMWELTLSFSGLVNGTEGPRAALQSAYNAEMFGVVEAGLADESLLEGLTPPTTTESAAE